MDPRPWFSTIALVTVSMLGAPAAASESTERAAAASEPEPFHFDLETDPTAFAFRGYSLHAGLGFRRFRLDLGVYAMDVPSFAEPNEGFESSFRGAGAKWQYFLFDEQAGGFVGLDAGLNELRVEDTAGAARASQLQVSSGVNFGWRFALPFGFYATPWLGISYSFNADTLVVGNRSYEPQTLIFFPAVHLGYGFF